MSADDSAAADEQMVVYPVAKDRLDVLVDVDDDLGLEPGTAFVAAVDLLKGFLQLQQDGYTVVARKDGESAERVLQLDLLA